MKWDKLAAIRTFALVIIGLGAIVWGAFLYKEFLGFLALGASCVLLAYLTDTTQTASNR